MTKKHYEMIAKAVRDSFDADPDGNNTEGIALVQYRLTKALEKENTKFDSKRFTRSCLGLVNL